MKKTITILLSILLFIGVSGCTKKDETADVPNPIREVATLSELIETINMAICRVEGDDVNDEAFRLIDGEYPVAEYNFKISGKDVSVRASKAPVSVDISGVYYNEKTLYGDYLSEESSCYIENDDFFSHRWFTLDGQYVITTGTDGFDYQEFEALVKPFEEVRPLNWDSDVAYEDYRSLCSYYSTDDGNMAAIIMEKDHVRVIVALGRDEGAITYEMPSVLKDGELLFKEASAVYSSYNPETGEMKSEELAPSGEGRISVNGDCLSFENSGIEEISGFVMTKFSY